MENAAGPRDRTRGMVAVLALAGIVAAAMQTLVIPFLGLFPQLLHTTPANASWLVTATVLTAAVVTPVSGRLGDLYGKRRMMLICSGPLFAGSVICALANSLPPMLVGRALQGVGTSLIPLGMSLLRDVLPPERLGSAVALISSSLGIGTALGLPIAATVAEHADRHVLFWGAAAMNAVVAALIWLKIPVTPGRPEGRFDHVGAIGLSAALVCLLLGVSKGADWGWGSGVTLGLLGAAAVLLFAWGRWELRTTDPLVDLRVAAGRTVLLTNGVSLAIGFAMYAQGLIVPQLLQLPRETGYGLGQSMLHMGLWMAPAGLMMMLFSPLGARLSAARGPKTTLVTGSLVIALAYGSSTVLLGSPWTLVIVTCVCNIGVALAYGAIPALIMGAVPRTETASANGFNTLMRSVGSSVSSAVVGVVLAQLSTDFGGRHIPSEGGFRTGMLIGCGVALLAAAVAATIPSARPRKAPATPVDQAATPSPAPAR
ncbi:MFS transporter [Yinghuangia sp. ASG 101]|uniref:MFS transporter n=1 Tax=Yinghuangia sp. ASG 101 TaxID=2896848 RepID=UPI001E31DF99|nr:MFS transporter [Yinghuangia sp. ASG 101]UGQ11865.1 MFS transporter [Yinghuangia sp. ASG 101]